MLRKQVICDNCGCAYSVYTNASNTLIKKWAREEGWSCGNKDLCTICKAAKRAKYVDAREILGGIADEQSQ